MAWDREQILAWDPQVLRDGFIGLDLGGSAAQSVILMLIEARSRGVDRLRFAKFLAGQGQGSRCTGLMLHRDAFCDAADAQSRPG